MKNIYAIYSTLRLGAEFKFEAGSCDLSFIAGACTCKHKLKAKVSIDSYEGKDCKSS